MNIEETNARLAELSRQIYPDGLLLKYVAVDELHEQDVNPRSMPQRMFDQLIENIKTTGTLESVPLCVYVDNRIEIISGHHRVRAARAAGVSHILVLVYTELSHSRLRSKQLAHNTISGIDDPEMVRRVWNEILDVQAQFEAYVDPRIFKAIPEPVQFAPVDVDMQAMARVAVIVFLPSQAVDYQNAVDAIMPKGQVDQVYLASRDVYDAWKEAIAKVREDCDIVAVPTAVAEMARLAVERLQERETETEVDAEAEAAAAATETGAAVTDTGVADTLG
jgi:hypothetical protein